MKSCLGSVIIPTYNRLNELRLTLDSLCGQTCRYSFEVLVCDDGSSENTKQLVTQYEGRLNILYLFQEDRGFRAAAARNMGIRASKGKWCIFIDNGVILHSSAIEEHILAHEESYEQSVVIGYVYGFDIDGDKQERLAQIIENSGENFDECMIIAEREGMLDIREKEYQILGSRLQDWPAPFLVCFSNNLSVSKQILLEIGMFDEYFVSWGGEDIELGLSLQEKGVNFILRRSVKSIHYPHKKNHQWETNPEVEIKNLQAKKEYILQKHPSELVMKWMDIYNIVELNQEFIKNRKQNQLH